MKHFGFIVFILFAFVSLVCNSSVTYMPNQKKDVSPYDYGLANAKTGTERYQVLLKTHRAAIKAGVNVDYSNIDTLWLEIPETLSRIPLTSYNDFKGCVFMIKNTSKETYLFDKKITGKPIEVDKWLIDKGDFRTTDSLKGGRYLLLIEDEKPWVLSRKGYGYGHQRKDVLLVENGIAKNKVIMPYNNEFSKPVCTFIHLNNEPLVIKNITIDRSPECTFLTHIAMIIGNDDVRISKVKVHTPVSNLKNDRGFLIRGCTNVTFEDVCIDGSYSQKNHSGYGIFLDNVWNFKAIRLYGRANWGIFGNNNVNKAQIEDSQINRFDIHCYGKDVAFKNVVFFDRYNQYSSVYGTISYDKCTFTDFVPVLNDGSYNSYVAHEVVFNDCIYNVSPDINYIFKMSNINEPTNERHELAEKCLPNVIINNMKVNMRKGAKEFFLFKFVPSGKNITDIGYLSKVYINGLKLISDDITPIKSVYLSNIKMQTKHLVDCQLKDVEVVQPKEIGKQMQYMRRIATLIINMTVKGGKVKMNNAKNLRQD